MPPHLVRHSDKPKAAPTKGGIQVNVIKNAGGKRLSKRYRLVDRKLDKEHTTNLVRGQFFRRICPFADGDATAALEALGEIISDLGSDEAIVLGRHRDDIADGFITAKSIAPLGGTTRTQECFVFPESEPGFMLLDADGYTGAVEELEALYPPFTNVGVLSRPSASSGLYDMLTRQDIPSGGGEHLYVVISDPSRSPEVLHAFRRLKWAKDKGKIDLSANGKALPRGPVDTATGTPERLSYEGRPVVVPPLAQRERPCALRPGGVLDVGAFLAVADLQAPEEGYQEQLQEETNKPEFKARQKEQYDRWRIGYCAKREAAGLSVRQAKAEAEALLHDVLLGTAEFASREGEKTLIADILFDPDKYKGQRGPDPVEGAAYAGASATTAMVMGRGDDGRVRIFSYAHGGILYTCKHNKTSIERGFEERFKADDGIEAFKEALLHAKIDETERTELIKSAAKFFKVLPRDLKTDAKRKAQDSQKQTKTKDPRIPVHVFADKAHKAVDAVVRHLRGRSDVYDYNGRPCILTPARRTAVRSDGSLHETELSSWAIRRLDTDLATLVIDRIFHFTTTNADGVTISVRPPKDVVAGVLANSPPRLPILMGITSTPPMSADGKIATAAGVHDNYFYDGSCGKITLPPRPTKEEAEEAWAVVREAVLCEFPFASPIDEATALAMMLTPLTRRNYQQAPLFVVDAPEAGTGKTLLVNACFVTATGSDAAEHGYDSTDTNETRKVITSALMAGDQVLFFDNIEGRIGCAPLNRAITSSTWKDRVLGGNESFSGQQNLTIAATANNATIEGDTTRRSLRLRLDAKGFENPVDRPITNLDLIGTIRARRPELVTALLTMRRWHCQNGYPGKCHLGGFEGWSKHVGCLVEALTGYDITETQSQVRSESLTHSSEVGFFGFFEEWFGDEAMTAAAVYDRWRLDPTRRQVTAAHQGFLEVHAVCRQLFGDKLNARWFAMRLAQMKGRQRNGRVLVAVPADNKNITRYRLEPAKGHPPIKKANPPKFSDHAGQGAY